MKFFSRNLSRDGSGSVTLLLENEDDVYVLYNILEETDVVTSDTYRKVTRENTSGEKKSERLRLILTVSIEQIDFDASTQCIRVNGKTTQPHEHVKQGAYHSIDLSNHSKLTLFKNSWDQLHLEALQEATNVSSSADVAAVVAEPGLCNIGLLTRSAMKRILKIEQALPKKRGAKAVMAYDRNFAKFLDKIYDAVSSFDFTSIKAILLGSPGHLNEQILEHIKNKAISTGNTVITSSFDRFILCNTQSGHLSSIYAAFSDPTVARILADTRVARETNALQNFFEMMGKNPGICEYGLPVVLYCSEIHAIKDLLIVDSMLRTPDKLKRLELVNMIKSVRQTGGSVFMLSSLLDSGKRLLDLGGVAAILKYEVEGLSEIEDIQG
ncbi:hypothetical protein RCL1_005489 [Eukaryota sp. TZLM3-RCL]